MIEIKAKITAVNMANAATIRLSQILNVLFSNYIGKQVVRKDGTLLASIKLPELDTADISVVQMKSENRLAWYVKASVPDERGNTVYHITTLFLGLITRDGKLEMLLPLRELRCDYSVENVKQMLLERELAKKAVDEISSKLGEFSGLQNFEI